MELLVAMSVIAIISSVVIFNARPGERNLALQRSAQNVLQAINQAANNALGGKRHDATNQSPTISQGGYGVHFEDGASVLTIFADCNQNQTLDISGTAPSCIEAPTEGPYPEEFEALPLENFIEINRIEFTGTGSPITPLDVVFIPPDGDILMNPAPPPGSDEAMIEIINTVEGDTIQIYINKAGATRVVIP